MQAEQRGVQLGVGGTHSYRPRRCRAVDTVRSGAMWLRRGIYEAGLMMSVPPTAKTVVLRLVAPTGQVGGFGYGLQV